MKFALRRLLKAPGFAAVAILTLGLGIGACTAIFSVVNGVLLRPLAYRAPERLVWLQESSPAIASQAVPVSAHHFQTWRERAQSFAGLSIVDFRACFVCNDAGGAIPLVRRSGARA